MCSLRIRPFYQICRVGYQVIQVLLHATYEALIPLLFVESGINQYKDMCLLQNLSINFFSCSGQGQRRSRRITSCK